MPVRLSERQLEVLHWIADGCPDRQWPDESHKHSARALASRGLARVSRKNKVWTATITGAGAYFIEHGVEPPPVADVDDAPTRLKRGQRRQGHLIPDATARAMAQVRTRGAQAQVRQTNREIKESYVRYKVVVTRVQVAERFVRATSEEEAATKVQAEFDRPRRH